MEKFAVPCVAAIIEKIINNEKYILIQTRQKEDGAETNGMLEIPAGKIREYENIFRAYSIILNTFLCEAEGELLTETNESQNIHWMKIEELKKIFKNNPEKIFLLHINALQKYLGI